ncbi:MalY/PatB family protein [Prauserella cavernicola]|uniref:cysteine-S-conjugate beta-lyase n=1 Tax=Prauserella cavernicola TaxID=2800127 RepID=A0A934V3Q0_9PSEU|nr:aminotransferase class I/II-fold pyridoxal phosphate-dependent enzyme [Prauserella cavernicola]MBK1782773.1 aminotransferase class I/II-fold pyridoxal phosphate-dependent enzyme [Prauserella cavernicola]
MSHPFDAVTAEHLRARGGVKWTLHDEDRLGAFIAEMDFGTAPPVLDALHSAVDALAFGYLSPVLKRELAQACASWLEHRHGWSVPAERIFPLPDVVKGLEAAIEHFSARGSAVILPTPAYMPFLDVPRLLGRQLSTVPMAEDAGRAVFDLDALAAAFRAGGNLLVLCNPANPLGRVFTESELAAVCEVVDRHGGRVFADEIHAPLVYPGHRHVPYASLSDTAAAHSITAVSASKAWNLPGLKCAQLITTNAADTARFAEVGEPAMHGASTLGVVANTAAYTRGGPWLEDVLRYLGDNRAALGELLAEHLPGVRCALPEGTYLAWLDCRGLGLGEHPGRFFAEHAGVVLVDGPECGEPGRGFARFNFATPRPILERAVAGMGAAVASAAATGTTL